jgi:hypothetical protein
MTSVDRSNPNPSPQGDPFACPTMSAIGRSPRAMITLTFGVIWRAICPSVMLEVQSTKI